MKNDPQLLSMILADELNQSPIYRAGPYWAPYQRRIVTAIGKLGLDNFRAEGSISKGYAAGVTVNPRDAWLSQDPLRIWLKNATARLPWVRGMLADYEQAVRINQEKMSRYADAYYQAAFGDWFREQTHDRPLPESTHGGSKENVTLNGRPHGRGYLDALMQICNFAEHTDFSRARTVFEIGGGFGSWVHILLNRYPAVRKVVYLDIPPIIYVGTQYLRHFFGDAVRDYRQTRSMDPIRFASDDSLEIICLCPWQIERLDASVDLFWNSSSFGEMTPEIVGNYARHVGRLLRPGTGAACLLLKKLDAIARDKGDPVPTDQIIGAFSGTVALEEFEPTVVPVYGYDDLYLIGHAAGTT